MKLTHRLLQWERDALAEAYSEGEKRDALCAEFGVSRSYPRLLARRRGVAARSAGRPPKRLQSPKAVLVLVT